MADANETQTETTTETQPDPKDLIPRAEAKQAFAARDKAKKEADELRKRLDAIEAANAERDAKAEEEKLKAAGQWDSLREQLSRKHADEVAGLTSKLTASEQRWRQREVTNAFASATDLFGREALTIYNAKAAERIFGAHVKVDDDGQVTIHDLSGEVILDAKTGKPASFAQGMRELIESLPDKNDHLRGSGKTGSGSSGGSATGSREIDFRNLTPEQRRDPKVLAALRASLPRGSVIMGEAYNQ